MKINIDDPRLTAYALGELNPTEREEIEKFLHNNEEAKAYVDEIRDLGGILENSLEKESMPDRQSEVTIPGVVGSERNVFKPHWSRKLISYPVAMGAIAALLLVVFMPVYLNDSSVLMPREESRDRDLYRVSTVDKNEGSAEGNELLTESSAAFAQEVEEEVKSLGKEKNDMDRQPVAANQVAAPAQAKPEVRSLPGAKGEVTKRSPAIPGNSVDEMEGDGATVSKFEVVSDKDDRYMKANAVSATGMEMQKVPMSLSAMGEDFLQDAGSTSVKDLKRYQAEGSDVRMKSMLPYPAPPILEESPVRNGRPDFNTEAYDRILENAFLAVQENPLSTFSIDVDTASYANMRRFINGGQLPPKGAVRIEELINYFSYDYPEPEANGEEPFSAAMEVGPAPWKEGHQLVRIGLRGESVSVDERPKANLVFLLDVSGSMNSPNKLPLVKQAMKVLVEHLQPEDRVAIAVYAGASGLVLPSTPIKKKREIFGALERLSAGGSTNGGMGIQLAYDVAKAHFVKDGVNRVILCTDGDFNVGTTNQGSLVELIEEKAKTGTFLTVLGFGMGNYKDSTLEKLADHGNGNYGYVDSLAEAKKLLGSQIDGTLVAIAKDVKIQVEFNPASVKAYRLIGYENRVLAKEDFNDDTKDAGEIGAGHTVTALYEIVPMDVDIELPPVDLLKYQKPLARLKTKNRDIEKELLTLKLRYKEPTGDTSELMEIPLLANEPTLDEVSKDFKFAAAVAGFGMLLRDSDYKGDLSLDRVIELAGQGLGSDEKGERMEFLSIVKQVRDMHREEG